jgi:nickel-dependent lactate racemase
MSTIGFGKTDGLLTKQEVLEIIRDSAACMRPAGKRVLVIIPDHTRTCPLPLVARELHAAIAPVAARLDFLVALGTHPPMSEQAIDKLLGIPPGQRPVVLPGSEVFNHEWDNPQALKCIGKFSRNQVAEYLGAGNERFAREIDVTINKLIFDYDMVMIAGPVFPHEVVGFSGGAKYFFPGICGPELLNFFHWLGALITIPKTIGLKDTPTRRMLHAAMDMITVEKFAMNMVVTGGDLAGLYFGQVRPSWSAAVDLADALMITYCDKPFDSILSRAPEMYDELWTGGKCMYKMECVVADGGELIIYAPHIRELAQAHGRIIEEIGYHCLPYFTEQWEKFKDYPWGILAHSTHVRGIGTCVAGREIPRVRVTLATGIPEDLCRKINMGYRDPAGIDIADWQGKEAQGRLYIPKAGEMLYRLKNPPQWQMCG